MKITATGTFERTKIRLDYELEKEKEILLDFFIKINKYKNINYIQSFINGYSFIEREFECDRKDVEKVIKCLEVIDEYQDYKTIEIKKLFSSIRERVKLTRDEKEIKFKSIINIIMMNQNYNVDDSEYLIKKLDEYLKNCF